VTFVSFVAVESRGEGFFEQARFGCGQGQLYDLRFDPFDSSTLLLCHGTPMNDLGRTTAYFLVGPTASGKGRLARALARRYGMEIVSMDSMKVYRGMDIGTAKPTNDERGSVPHHVIDVADPIERFDLARWIDASERAILDIAARGRKPLVCGGTGLYLKGLLSGIFEGPSASAELRRALEEEIGRRGPEALHRRLAELDGEAADRIHPHDARRVIRALEVIEITGEAISKRQVQFEDRRADLDARLVGLLRDRSEQDRRIEARVRKMLEAGWLEEVRALTSSVPLGPSASQALGYRELAEHLSGVTDLEKTSEAIVRNTRRFVRRQMNWFRKFGDIRWIEVRGDSDREETVLAAAKAFSLVQAGDFP